MTPSRFLPMFATFAALSQSTPAQTFTLEHYAKLSRVTDVRIAPNGKSALFVIARPNYTDNVWESELNSIDIGTKRVRELTHQRKTVARPRWSPNGAQIAFLANASGKAQVFVLDLEGGEARQITHSATAVQSFSWNPEGTAFAYMAAEEAPKRDKFDDSFYVDNNDYLAHAATLPVHLWVIDASESATARRLTSGKWTVSGIPTWQPGTGRILFVSHSSPGTRASFDSVLQSIPASGGQPEPIAGATERKCGRASPSPDGKWLVAGCKVDGETNRQRRY